MSVLCHRFGLRPDASAEMVVSIACARLDLSTDGAIDELARKCYDAMYGTQQSNSNVLGIAVPPRVLLEDQQQEQSGPQPPRTQLGAEYFIFGSSADGRLDRYQLCVRNSHTRESVKLTCMATPREDVSSSSIDMTPNLRSKPGRTTRQLLGTPLIS